MYISICNLTAVNCRVPFSQLNSFRAHKMCIPPLLSKYTFIWQMITLINTSPCPAFPHIPKLAERVIPVLLSRPVIKALGVFNIFDPCFTRSFFPSPRRQHKLPSCVIFQDFLCGTFFYGSQQIFDSMLKEKRHEKTRMIVQ